MPTPAPADASNGELVLPDVGFVAGSYRVRTSEYEGPFDLLLHLILRDEVDLYEVSLLDIVDAYLGELAKMDDLDLEVMTEFLLIAATLVELKCRRVLPVDSDFDLDDELALWEERDLLLSRLLEAKTFKDAAKRLELLAEQAAQSYPRLVGLEDQFLDLTPDLLAGVKPSQLRQAFLKVVAPRPVTKVTLTHVTQVKVSVAEVMSTLIGSLPRLGRTSFRSLTSDCTEKIEIVVYFLAVLELYKQGVVDVDQVGAFGTLSVQWTGEDYDPASLLADLYEG
ncbi:MAG: ScpA family protein [Acidimicrobiales bacterium]